MKFRINQKMSPTIENRHGERFVPTFPSLM
jgi:hypothetical protein